MATPVDLWGQSTSQSTVRRGVIVAGALLVLSVAAWQLSQNPLLVAVVTAAAGAIGLVLARARDGRLMTGHRASPVTGWDALQREIDRSRRHERSLALASISLPDAEPEGNADDMMATIGRVRSQLRSIDVLWTDGSRLWVLMPESGREGGTTALRRIMGAAPETRGDHWKLVVFPDDAMTFGALIAELDAPVPVEPVSPPLANPPTAS